MKISVGKELGECRVITSTPRDEFLRRMSMYTGNIYRGDRTKSHGQLALETVVRGVEEESIEFDMALVKFLYWKESTRFRIKQNDTFSDEIYDVQNNSLVVVLPKSLRDWWLTDTEFRFHL